MKIISKYWVLGSHSGRHADALSEVSDAISKTYLELRPVKKGNGVRPIKDGVITSLKNTRWLPEHRMDLEGMRAKPFDAFKEFPNCRVGFEWETGNISSSFRALMKLIKGLAEGKLDLGIHVLPSKAMYNYLTDRIGNIDELLPYLSIFSRIDVPRGKALLIIVIEHDRESEKALLIPKGNDGMSLTRRLRK